MSRMHPGKSSEYNKKVETRKQREFDRELLRLAKERHQKNFGDKPFDRVKLRRYKKEIRKELSKT